MSEKVFRDRAVAHKARAAGSSEGDVLRLSPRWVDASYRVVVGIALASFAFATCARVGEYASGPVVVRFDDRRAVTATEAGTVGSVQIAPGDSVLAGDPLVSLHHDLEDREREQAEDLFRTALVEYLRDPVDDARRSEVTRRRSERSAARARADAKVVRAPVDGVISDVWATEGQALTPGALIASIRGASSQPTVVALLPGRLRPLLAVGQPLQISLPGFEQVSRVAEIVAIGGEVVGPGVASRALGVEAEDAVVVSGPCVVVRARLLDPLLDDGLPYFHGMTGQATVRVRSEPVLVSLLPALRPLLGSAW